MDAQKVDMYLMANAKYFDSFQIAALREMMLNAPDSKSTAIYAANLKDPTTILIVSLLAGSLGIDRFLMGDTGLGIAKLLTCGGFGIWSIVDWFIVMGRARELNFQRMQYMMSL